MRRYHNELAIIRKQHRLHLRVVHGWPKKPVDCPCDMQAGRFRKKDAFDCGQTMCNVCNYEKWRLNGGHEITRQELLMDLRQKEQLQELVI